MAALPAFRTPGIDARRESGSWARGKVAARGVVRVRRSRLRILVWDGPRNRVNGGYG